DRHVPLEDLRAGRRADALRPDHVLERDRNALAVTVVEPEQERVQVVLARAIGVEELAGRDLLALEQPARLLRGESQRVDHADGGTRKASSSRCGALANTSSSGRHGRGSSGRRTLTSSSGWEVGRMA